MTDQVHLEGVIAQRAARPSLIENFEIDGLYGYRSIGLASQFAATILIAKNGAGKTTLLGALDAFLRGQFHRLKDIDFREIRCKLRTQETELRVTSDDIRSFCNFQDNEELTRAAIKHEIDLTRLVSFLFEELHDFRRNYSTPMEHDVFGPIYRNHGFKFDSAISYCEGLKSSIESRNPIIKQVVSDLKIALKGVELLYLPTYRRVELPMIDDNKGPPHRRNRPFRLRGRSLFGGDIQFGLADISERLSEMNQTILVDSNRGYARISANIINELIDGTFESEIISDQKIPDKAELSLFISRLQEGRKVRPYSEFSIPNIDKIYSGNDIPGQSNKFLRYFLSKLSDVIAAVRPIENQVQDFVDSCNKYLTGDDASTTTISNLASKSNDDRKELRVDRQNLAVHVESISAKRKISIDSLSSGEKQMVSLFAKLFLYPNEKVVLIDEPELSLSLDWQRQILTDVVRAPLCRQIIAITHSPFVFDNELEPFARSVKLAIDTGTADNATDSDIAGSEDEGEHGDDE